MAAFRKLALALLAAVLLIPAQPAHALVVSNVQITCAKDGVEETFTTGWDSDNQAFEGKGDIAKWFCEGGHSSFGAGASYVSDTLGDSAARYYTGEATATQESEITAEDEATGEANTSTTVSQDNYDALKKEYDDYKAWAEAAIADYKGTISGYINRIDSLKESLLAKEAAIANLQKQLEDSRAGHDAYKTEISQLQDKLQTQGDQLSEALAALAKSKSEVELQSKRAIDLEAQLKASQERVVALESRLKDVEERLATLQAKADNTDRELAAALQQIATLTAQLADANATIAEQQQKIEELRAILSNEDTEQNLALAAEVKEIANAKLATAAQGSEDYEAGLALLAVAAIADDPELPEAIEELPVLGVVAAQVLDAVNEISNVGADMTVEVRERSEEVVVAGVIVGGQIASASAVQAVRRAKV